MSISQYMRLAIENGSMVRKMFEEGIRLKSLYSPELVFDYSLGNPDLSPPTEFFQAVKLIMDKKEPGGHGYMPNAGFMAVRKELAKNLTEIFGKNLKNPITEDLVVLTVGAAGGMNDAFKAILDPGDEVTVLAPYFMEYKFYVENHGGTLRVSETDENFRPVYDNLDGAIGEKTKAVIINSPNNPTGVVYSKENIDLISSMLIKKAKLYRREIYLISDEPYRKIAFGVTVPSVFESYPNSIIVNSFSKDLSIPGERLGYLCVNPMMPNGPEVIAAATLANRILGFVSAPALVQRVLPYLLNQSVDIDIYRRRMEVLTDGLKDAGYTFIKPEGSFYVFPKSPLEDDQVFVDLLKQELILAVPGSGFGRRGYFRLSLCLSEEKISRSLDGFYRTMEKTKVG